MGEEEWTRLLFAFGLHITLSKAADNWQRFPTLETFVSYEDMQRYFDQRNFRSMRHIENPNDDSYLDAFNQYNEQPANPTQTANVRTKRAERQLPSAPRMLRFDLSDAVEPSQELKQLLRQYQQRALQPAPAPARALTPAPTAPSAPVAAPSSTAKPSNKRSRKPRRLRRSTLNQQPANFKVEMIPFEATDAREPDAITAQHIQRARALDLQREPAPTEVHPSAKQPKRKSKRAKRSAPLQLVKFELADAKTSLPASLQRTGKNLSPTSQLTMEANQNQHQNRTTTQTSQEENMLMSGESAAESKRLYVYKEAPIKAKKSISTLPHEVQKVISHIIKDGNGGKAYIKYLTPQKVDYEHYKAKTISYVPKPTAYIKYMAPKPVEPVHVHIQPVPVVEQLRYVYKPQYAQVYQPPHTIQQPIVVQETPQAVEQVHHTYTAEAAAEPALPEPKLNVIPPQFRPSKPDPLLESAPVYGRPIEQYQYEIQAEPDPTQSPLIKIEYHAPADKINEHYKQMPEFRELSTLIGKSPDDQIHGLTYLLAKEMQAKLQRQPKQLLVAQVPDPRPQDNTAPILFHPGLQQPPPVAGAFKTDLSSLGVQPGRLIGMGKTKQYVPIVESSHNDVKELPAVVSSSPIKLPTPSSFVDYMPGHGLSHGYEGVRNEQPFTTVEHIVHQPTLQKQPLLPQPHPQPHPHPHPHQAILATSLPAHLEGDKIENGVHYVHSHDDKSLHQYASKYAFGYRIRDFHTGNDFGHKQNRDLHGVTRGQYHILLPDGRVQNVIYHADDTGFHADVSFESGTTRH
ncbi:GH21032 [Drosophila grimshawi]|uniref:GH21032 n=1 Tax=Drosophila grimshawi TaxID=7222 RepID=B4J579_DROGR|nr:GH21032 [Drosophila grimshawi]